MLILCALLLVSTTAIYAWRLTHPLTEAATAESSDVPPTGFTSQKITLEPATPQPPAAQAAPSAPPPASPPAPTPDTTPDIPPLQPSAVAPVFSKIKTAKRVVFMGVDDGIVKDPRAVDYIKQHHYPFTLFLANNLAGNNYDYFKPLISDAGDTVEDHTLHHPVLSTMSLEQQKQEICGQADIVKRVFGTTPTLFRPPFGDYNALTQRAAAACGMKAVVLWSAKVNDGKIQYQTGKHFVPGDILLMHFRPKIMEDLQAFTNEVESQHLTVAKLEDWLR